MNFHVSLFYPQCLKLIPWKVKYFPFLEHLDKFHLDLHSPRYNNSPTVSCLGMNPERGWNPDLKESYLPTPMSTTLPTTIDWPDIGSSPINEYNTEGLFDIAFPTLFPNEDALPHQACIKNISLDTDAIH